MANPWLQWWIDKAPLLEQPTFPRLILALILGSVIGAERQWRQRAAGMRTNTLVCFGAAAFVDLGAAVGGPTTTNVIAYVVSGVGFLGAGAIMKEGRSISGLNTAATLWCSAAVGACVGAGEMLDAVFVTALLVGINLLLRPLSRYIDKKSLARAYTARLYRIGLICPAKREHQIREVLLHAMAERPITLRELRTEDAGDAEDVYIHAVVESSNRDQAPVEELVAKLRAAEGVHHLEWAETSLESE
jgi:putative Mg2+ transporter-C (MgtC) family protein